MFKYSFICKKKQVCHLKSTTEKKNCQRSHRADKKQKVVNKWKTLFPVTQFILILFLFSGESCKKQSEKPVSEDKKMERVDNKTIIVPKDFVSRNLIELQINLLKALKKKQWTEIKQYIFGEGIIDNCLLRKEKISLKPVFDKLKTKRITLINKNQDCRKKIIPDFYKQNHCSVSNYCKTLDLYLDINKNTYQLRLKQLVKLRGKWWVTGMFKLSKTK